MSRMCTLRSVLALAILVLITLWAVPAYSWHGSGNITALAIAPRTDPETPTTLYAGTSDRGVFKSVDGGATWSATGLTNAEVWALAIDPVTPTTLYAVSGWQYYFGASYQKLYKSTDGGANWDLIIVNLASASFQSLVIDPQTPTTLYGLGDGAFKSTDGGASWSATGLTGWGLGVAIGVSFSGDPSPDPRLLSMQGRL